MYGSIHFNKCIHPYDHHNHQNIKHLHHLRKFPCTPLKPIPSIVGPGPTTNLPSIVTDSNFIYVEAYSIYFCVSSFFCSAWMNFYFYQSNISVIQNRGGKGKTVDRRKRGMRNGFFIKWVSNIKKAKPVSTSPLISPTICTTYKFQKQNFFQVLPLLIST